MARFGPVVFDIIGDNMVTIIKSKSRLVLKNVAKVCRPGEQRVYHGLVVAFALFFVLPTLGLINFAFRYRFVDDSHISYYLLFVLVFAYLGFYILRTHANRLRTISEEIEQYVPTAEQGARQHKRSEITNIAICFQQVFERLEQNNHELEKRAAQLGSLANLADSVSAPIEENSLLEVCLQAACEGVGAGRGSVLMLDESRQHHFTVACCIDTRGDGHWQGGQQIPFSETNLREAVLMRSPLFLTDLLRQEPFAETCKRLHQDCGPALVVPVITSKDVVGVICLEEKRGAQPFSPVDADYIRTLAAFMSHRYEYFRLENSIQLQTQQLNCLSGLNRLCSLGVSRGKVLQLVVRELRRSIPVKVLFLALADPKKEYLEVLEVAAEEIVAFQTGMRLRGKLNPFSAVLKENREIHQENLTSLLDPLEAKWFQELGIHSCYLVPFRIHGVNAGMLVFGSDSDRGFSRPQQTVLQQVGHYLGLAMHNHLLMQEIYERSRELDAINQCTRLLATSLFDLAKTVDQVGNLIDQLIAIEAGAIYLREDESFVLKKSFGAIPHQIKRGNLRQEEGICAYVISRGEPILIEDASRNPHLHSLVVGCGTQTRSVLCVPIVGMGQVVGVILLWNKAHNTFTGHDEKVVQSLAAHLAIAWQNYQLQRLCSFSSAERNKSGSSDGQDSP